MKNSGISFLISGLVLTSFTSDLSAQDVARGNTLYKGQCASCHGDRLQGRTGPPLIGTGFASRYSAADLVSKIRNTMPQDKPGTLSAAQSADLAAYIQQASPASTGASSSTPESDFAPAANLQQLMRGMMFPNSNIIFTVQTHDPGEKKRASDAAVADGGFNWTQWGTDLYTGWDIVDYAALALAESAPLLLTPGRRCENGKPVPVDAPDWIRFTREMAEVGRAAYRASQTRSQEKVSDTSNDVADACLHCHEVYRDRRAPGGGPEPSKELRCSKN